MAITRDKRHKPFRSFTPLSTSQDMFIFPKASRDWCLDLFDDVLRHIPLAREHSEAPMLHFRFRELESFRVQVAADEERWAAYVVHL